MQGRILVTGATGTIGRELLHQLRSSTVAVRAGVRTLPSSEPQTHVEFAAIDFTEPDTLRAAMQGVDKLFLLTPNAFNAVEMATTAVAVAKETGVTHIVRLSAYSDEEETTNPHRLVENVIEGSGLPYTFLRPGPFMQNFALAFGAAIRAQSALYEPLGDARVSYIDTRDIAKAAAVVLTEPGHENRSYHLTGPEALSDTDIARILSEVTGRTIRYVDISEDDARSAFIGMGMPDMTIANILRLYGLMRVGKRAQVSDAIETLTGAKAGSFHTFAHDHRDAFV